MAYIVGHPIKNPADFFGRSHQIRRFFEIVAGTQAQSVSVLGLRRAGKTSFLHHVAEPQVMAQFLPDVKRYVMIYLDVSFCRTPAEFYHRLWRRLHAALQQVAPHNAGLMPSTTQVTMYDVETLLYQFGDRRVILLLDEFDQLRTGEFDQDFLTELRALTSSWDYELACVTASYWDLYKLGEAIGLPPTSPFYNIFYPTAIYLSGLQTAEAETLIRTPAARANYSCSEQDVAQIGELAGTLPFFLQATAARWFQEKRNGQRPTPESVVNYLVSVLARYFAQWWRHFGACERDILRTVAQQGSIAGTSCNGLKQKEALRQLYNYGLLRHEAGQWVVNGRILAAWLRSYSELDAMSRAAPEALETNPVALRKALAEYFSLDELRLLCFDLNVDYDELGGGRRKSDKAAELVNYWKRKKDLETLAEAIRRERGAIV